jgi:hypothetical protein
MWVSADQAGVDRGIFTTSDRSNGTDAFLGMRYDAQGYRGGGRNGIKVGLRTDEGVLEYESASNVQTTDWQHLTVSWKSGRGIKLYVNGKLDTATASSGSLGGEISDVEKLLVGVGSKDGNTWNGEIDDFLIFDRQLSASDVSSLYKGDYSRVF